jgi:hypothetical protein
MNEQTTQLHTHYELTKNNISCSGVEGALKMLPTHIAEQLIAKAYAACTSDQK